MKRTRNGILIPDVPIMAGGNLPNAVKGVSAGGGGGFDPLRTPFYIDVRGPVTLAATSGLQMSTDGENWRDTVAGDLPVGKTYFCVASDQTSPLKPNWTENENSDYDIGGNINSLVKSSFEKDTTCYRFYTSGTGFFYYKTKLKSAGNLILPATTLTDSDCYQSMFYGCSSLTTAPALPATTLTPGCYQSMFDGCSSLTTAPALPATTLTPGCYKDMFYGCTSLTTAPELPATAMAESCYYEMFYGCSSLTTAPELPAMTMFYNCYYSMFYNCTSLRIAPTLPATTLANQCYYQMFYGCTSLTTAPALPATTLKNSCYYGMFNYCTALTTAPELPATTLTKNCYYYMFSNCTSLTAAPELPATTLTNYCYYRMFQSCYNLNYIKCLATNISASNCINNWVSSVAPQGEFIKDPSTNWPTGTSGIPEGWTVEESD